MKDDFIIFSVVLGIPILAALAYVAWLVGRDWDRMERELRRVYLRDAEAAIAAARAEEREAAATLLRNRVGEEHRHDVQAVLQFLAQQIEDGEHAAAIRALAPPEAGASILERRSVSIEGAIDTQTADRGEPRTEGEPS